MRRFLLLVAGILIFNPIQINVSGQNPVEQTQQASEFNDQYYNRQHLENPDSGYNFVNPDPKLAPLVYCAASGGCIEHIGRVQAGTINNITGCSGYANYTATHQTTLPLNGILWIAVTNGAPYTGDQCGIWVDWNRDSDFSDANETIAVTGTPGNGPYTANFTPPAGTITGQVTMRIRVTWTGAVSPCGTTDYGEVEDYSIIITPGSSVNNWTGAYSADWHTPGNWSLGVIPTNTMPVNINSGTTYNPVISSNAVCKDLVLATDAILTQNALYFDVYGNFDAGFGQFIMSGAGTYLYFMGAGNALWWDDNQNDVYTNVRIEKATTAQVTMKFNTTCSGTFEIKEGVFDLATDRVLNITNTTAAAFEVENGGKLILDSYFEGINVAGNVHFFDGSQIVSNDGTIYCAKDFVVDANAAYNITLSAGSLHMIGSSTQYINYQDGGTFEASNLVINKSGGVCYLQSANLSLMGSLFINQGTLSCNNGPSPTATYNISVKTDWGNQVGPDGFEESTGKVTFNGGDYSQFCNNETFNILEINKTAGGTFTVTGNVVCATYDWTAGVIAVNSNGNFTALDLTDNGLFGGFSVYSDATMNLYQDAAQWVDINGHLKFNGGGTINVYGENGDSWWAFTGNATLDMSGGVLDFKNSGIIVQNSGSSLTMNLNSDAVIRTTGGLNASRTGFAPTNGTFEFYGSSDRTISCGASNSLPNIRINKSAKSDEGSDAPQPSVDLHDGSVITDGSRANNISLNSNVTVNGNVVLQSGTLTLNSRTLNVGDNCTVYGTLKMTNPSDQLVSGFKGLRYLEFMPGSIADISYGLIRLQGILRTHSGSSFNLTTGNTIEFYGISSDGALHNDEPSATYGNIILNKNPGGPTVLLAVGSTAPFVVDGNFTINPGNVLRIMGKQLSVKGILTDASDSQILFSGVSVSGGSLELTNGFTLNGLLNIDVGSVLVHGLFNSATTSSIMINGGSLIADADLPDETHVISGNLTITDGLFEITNSSLNLNNLPKNVSGGAIRTGRNFTVTDPDIFHPTGGNVEMVPSGIESYLRCYNGNYLYNLDIYGSSVWISDQPLIIKNDLTNHEDGYCVAVSDIYIEGDWYSYGDNAVADGQTVFFTGSSAQELFGFYTTFWNVVNAKTSGTLTFNVFQMGVLNDFLADNQNIIDAWFFNVGGLLDLSTGSLTIQGTGPSGISAENLLMGGLLEVLGGTFTANDLVNNGIFGSFKISGTDAVCNLYQDALQFVDLNAEILLEAGEMNIYGGADDSWWTYGGHVILQMTGGVLDFKDVGVYVYHSPTYYLSTWISGGNIRTSGSFIVGNPNFEPWGGIVELYGGLSSVINTATGNFYHLTINKTSETDDLTLVLRNREGQTINRTRANDVVMTGNVLVEGVLSIDHGKLNSGNPGHELICNAAPYTGSLLIQDGGTLELEPRSKLKLSNLLRVSPLGTFISKGTPGQEVLVTKASSTRYIFTVYPLGNFSAEHTIFEFMNILGISLDHASWINPEKAFNFCTFREGLAGEPLLYINNDQDLLCTGAIFPENTWGSGSNVRKSDDSGYMTFIGYSGAFGGAAFEDDPYDRIEWYGSTPTHLVNLPAGWSGLSSYIMPAETNIPNLMFPVASNLSIMQTMSGIYYPSEGINTIGTWSSQSAYTIKMNAASTLPVTGLPEHNKTLNLNLGWNLIPVIANSLVNIPDMVSGLGSDLQIIKEVAGDKMYWPAFGIHTLSQLIPGRAYYTRMAAGGSVTFPNNVADNILIPDEPIKELATPWNPIKRTPVSHIIGIESDGLQDIQEGDIIGVFTTDGLCAGYVRIENLSKNHALYAFADDQLTPEADGFADSQPMIFRLYRPSTDKVFQLDVVFDISMPDNNGLFASEGISVIQSITSVSTGVNEQFANGLYIYPNPTSGEVTIGGIEGIELITVLGTDGSIISKQTPKTEGSQKIDLSGLPSGVYQIQLRTNQGMITRKVVKGK